MFQGFRITVSDLCMCYGIAPLYVFYGTALFCLSGFSGVGVRTLLGCVPLLEVGLAEREARLRRRRVLPLHLQKLTDLYHTPSQST